MVLALKESQVGLSQGRRVLGFVAVVEQGYRVVQLGQVPAVAKTNVVALVRKQALVF